ncbi:Outer membrane protein assembly factor YaeT precursor [Fimbriiglobus ruber]|uniref:Outer membrane protein assembly factor YaeT n=1 Tax=Fimbriiglobus ruber TaxID=1908690 RepID=A0A225DPS5_9BACT|nr:Outer membrane protein assembly factor YaeT precursor [Fimbriiglobus ruber]
MQPQDVLHLSVADATKEGAIDGLFTVDADGTLDLGENFGGPAKVANLKLKDVEKLLADRLADTFENPTVTVGLSQSRGAQEIPGQHIVRPDGTISLGSFGNVKVTGMTPPKIKAAIEKQLGRSLDKPEIEVEVSACNSKYYYVVTDISGNGGQIVRVPSSGGEAVTDVVSSLGGAKAVVAKRMWVARQSGTERQILPVDWTAITRGQTGTNYQLLPGDRLFIVGKPAAESARPARPITTPRETAPAPRRSGGEPDRVGRLIIEGNTITGQRVILNEIALYPGQILDYLKLKQAESALSRLGIFDRDNPPMVEVLSADSDGAYKDIRVRVKEARTGKLELSSGLSTGTGLFGLISISEQNFDIFRLPASLADFLSGHSFRGARQIAGIEITIGTRAQTCAVTLHEPRLFDGRYGLTFRAHLFRHSGDKNDGAAGWEVDAELQRNKVALVNVAYGSPDGLNVSFPRPLVNTARQLYTAIDARKVWERMRSMAGKSSTMFGGGMTLPSAKYLEHLPQYFAPDPASRLRQILDTASETAPAPRRVSGSEPAATSTNLD